VLHHLELCLQFFEGKPPAPCFTMPSPRTAALKRPTPPATVRPAAQVQQRKLPSGDPLKAALHLLQLAKVPSSIGSLHRKVVELHPHPERTWTWDLARSYKLVFDNICQASGSPARSCSTRR